MMNDPSRLRLERARSIAAVYAGHPDVRAIILGGSAARGVASADSDIDMGIFWQPLASPAERSALIDGAGGRLKRSVENELRYEAGNPRRKGRIEIIELAPSAGRPPMKLDIEHETVAGTEQVLIDVLEGHDASLEKQELLSVLSKGIPLYGSDLLGRWRQRCRQYPPEVARQMVLPNIIGIGERLMDQIHWADRQDWFCLYEGFLDIGRLLLLALMGLNRTWAFTDNPDFKGLKSFVEALDRKPADFLDRLDLLMQGDALSSIRDFTDLSEEVFDLIEAHMPGVETAAERRQLQQVRRQASRSP